MDALAAHIAEMEADGADRCDPVRFCYIRSLAARARGKPEPVAAAIHEKARAALTVYETEFERARMEAENITERVCAEFPDAAPRARQLFAQNEFKQVHRFARQLDLRVGQTPLSELTGRIGRAASASEEKTACSGLDALLRQQEQAMVASEGSDLAGGGAFERAEKTEMQSARHFKEVLARLHTERLITGALQERPDNPGPLNARMLAIRSLAALQQLSPAYLFRFVNYIDTLLWLQQAGEELDKRKAS